jgi:hypothetical protein
MFDPGYLSLAAGDWLLVSGCWYLVTRLWFRFKRLEVGGPNILPFSLNFQTSDSNRAGAYL